MQANLKANNIISFKDKSLRDLRSNPHINFKANLAQKTLKQLNHNSKANLEKTYKQCKDTLELFLCKT